VAPNGDRTDLAITRDGVEDPAGWLTGVANVAGEAAPTTLSYDAGGLLVGMVNAIGAAHVFEYDELGRLTDDYGPGEEGERKESHLTRTAEPGAFEVSVTDTVGGEVVHRVSSGADGPVTRVESPAGWLASWTDRFGTAWRSSPSGDTRSRSAADPVLGAGASYARYESLGTLNGLGYTGRWAVTRRRTVERCAPDVDANCGAGDDGGLFTGIRANHHETRLQAACSCEYDRVVGARPVRSLPAGGWVFPHEPVANGGRAVVRRRPACLRVLA